MRGISKKWVLLLGIGFVVMFNVTLFFYLFFFSDKTEEFKNNISSSSIIEFRFEEENADYKVVNLAETNKRWLYKNGNPVELLSFFPVTPTPHLELPKTRASSDITKTAPKLDKFTFESTLEQSAEYLNFLTKQGYQPIRKVFARNYIEVILTNNTDKLKRVIIQERLLMVGEISKSTSLPSLEDYLQDYRVLGGEK